MKCVRMITGLAALAAAFASAPAMAVTPIGGELETAPQLVVEGTPLSGAYPNGFQHWTGSPTTLDSTADYALNLFGGSLVSEIKATADASWASAASGNVSLDYTFGVAADRSGVLPAGYVLDSYWDYTFTPATDATLTVNYDVEAAGFGVSTPLGWEIQMLADNPFSSPIGPPVLAEGSGVYSVGLTGGQTYTLDIYSSDSQTYDSSVDIAGVEDSKFDWSIAESTSPGGGPAPAPEPSTWALTISGLGLAGCALRRRPRVRARTG